jgi:hypothetical protein
MIKKFLAVMALGSALSGFAPTAVFAADRDDHRDRERIERREIRENRDRRDRDDRRDVRYSRGYYDRDGCWHDRRW